MLAKSSHGWQWPLNISIVKWSQVMNRRDFLKAVVASGCFLGVGGISNLFQTANASDSVSVPLVLIIFLRGGADGLQLVGPSGDSYYVSSRPPQMRAADGSEVKALILSSSLDDRLGFAMNASGSPLFDHYRQGRLAIVHAVGLTDATRSHFVAERLIEAGLTSESQLNTSGQTGWVTRAVTGKHGPVSAFSATASSTLSQHGLSDALTAPDLAGGLDIPMSSATFNFLEKAAALDNNLWTDATSRTLSILQTIDRRQPRDAAGRIVPAGSDTKVSYNGAGDLARSLPAVARLANMEVGLCVACIDFGGWDTHVSQSGRVNSLFSQLATGLAVFQEDMAIRNISVTTVVMTEFGRRVRANKSDGTDHGHGACWFVLGDKVRGGRMYGQWPGLATTNLDNGVDLKVTTDYRLVLKEVMEASLLDASKTFPDYLPRTPLGLMA